MTHFAPTTHPDGDEIGRVGQPSRFSIYLVSTPARFFKDLKTKCTRAGKEVPEKRADGF